MAARVRPPGPRGHFFTGNLPEYRRNPLVFLTQCARTYGDIVSLRFGRQDVLLLSNPDHIEYVLATNHRNFTKGFKRIFRPLLGQGLFTSDGDDWLRQRRVAQPAFQRQRLAVHGETTVALTQRMLARWQDGEVRDLHDEMMHLSLEISARTILGLEESDEAHEFGCAMEQALGCIEGRSGRLNWLSRWLPTPNNLRLRRALRRLDAILYPLIEKRRAGGKDRDDLLSLLLHTQADRHEASQTADRQARDQIMNYFIAGRETTALALSWTWCLLGHHPGVVSELEKELDGVLGGRPPTAADLPQLAYAERVVLESLRLFPPAFALGRTTLHDCEIGGYPVPAGTKLLLVQWILHRDARYFDRPDNFLPERWADGLAQRLPKYAYFPFGAGPRVCIGNALAMMNIVLTLATVAQEFRVAFPPNSTVTIWPNVTLRPWQGIRLVLKRREAGLDQNVPAEENLSASLCVKTEESTAGTHG